MKDDQMVLDHVAVAVLDLEKSVKRYENLGLVFSDEREIVEDQAVKTAFAPIDNHANLELLCPTNETGPIAQYLSKKGEGIHHLCFKVSDIHQKSEELKKQGFVLIYDRPKLGAHGKLVNFIHPKSNGGVMIELSQEVH